MVMDAMVAEGVLYGRGGHGDPLHRQLHHPCQKEGALVGFDGHKRVEGTKVHAAVTEGSLPVVVMVGSAREHEGRKLIPLMESISIRHRAWRPRKRPGTVYADTKYAMPLNRFYLDGKQIR